MSGRMLVDQNGRAPPTHNSAQLIKEPYGLPLSIEIISSTNCFLNQQCLLLA